MIPCQSTYRLDRLFAPRSVALVGASPREKSLGRAILNNLRNGGWSGPLHLVNPKHREIDGLPALKDLSDLPAAPDLVIITVPPDAVPDVVARSAQMGAAAAIIITAGLGHGPLLARCGQAGARQRLAACLSKLSGHPAGPETHAACGMHADGGRARADFQSGAIAAGMIDWAAQRRVGFPPS